MSCAEILDLTADVLCFSIYVREYAFIHILIAVTRVLSLLWFCGEKMILKGCGSKNTHSYFHTWGQVLFFVVVVVIVEKMI